MGPKRCWREVEALALFEPLVEELAEIRSDTVGARSLFLNEVAKCTVCSS